MARAVAQRPQRAALDPEAAAEYLGLRPTTLKKWRTIGEGPVYAKLGGRVVYLVEDLNEYLYASRVI